MVNKLLAARFDLEIHVNQAVPVSLRTSRTGVPAMARKPADDRRTHRSFVAVVAVCDRNRAAAAAVAWRFGARAAVDVARRDAEIPGCPFPSLYAAGSWLGFPVSTPGDPAPAALIQLFAVLNPALAPAKFAALHGLAAWALLALQLTLTIAWSLHIARQMRVEDLMAQREIADEAAGSPAASAGAWASSGRRC